MESPSFKLKLEKDVYRVPYNILSENQLLFLDSFTEPAVLIEIYTLLMYNRFNKSDF